MDGTEWDTQQETHSEVARLDTEVLQPGSAAEYPNAYRIGPYEIQGIIGKGGMGIVYKAEVRESCGIPVGRSVALKMLNDSRLDPQDRRRFDREAAYLQALRHPAIVRILDIGEHEGRPFLVMQMVEGQTLDQILRQHRREKGLTHLQEDQAADILTQGLEGLHVAHLAGIVHRDLKPGNIMVTPHGSVKILDFGMAHQVNVDSHLTATGSVLGTPAYMSPEQASGNRMRLDARTDIYAMGAVAYELATGQQPYKAENSMAMLRLIIEGELIPPSEIKPDIDANFETIILKAMAHDQRDRYTSAEQMAEDLRRWRAGERIKAKRVGNATLLMRRAYKHRRTLSIVGLVLFVVGMGTALTINRLNQMRLQREAEALEKEKVIDDLVNETTVEWKEVRSIALLDADSIGKDTVRNKYHPSAYVTARIGKVTTNPRLSLVLDRLAENAVVELMICDPDVGQGYTLQIRRSAQNGDKLSLLRAGSGKPGGPRSLVKQIPIQAHGELPVRFERDGEGFVLARLHGQPAIRFWDPDPIEGPDHINVYITALPGEARVGQIRLESETVPKYVDRLEKPDLLRQVGFLERAQNLYEAIIEDTEDPDELRDARYRLGLCYVQDDATLEQALDLFRLVAEQSQFDHEAYFIAATVQAWVCTVRLKRYEDAEQYFKAIFPRYDLNEVLVSVPRETLKRLPQIYLKRAAEAEEQDDIEGAVKLYDSAASLADHLGQLDVVPTANWRAGDLLINLQRFDEGKAFYQRVYAAKRLPRLAQVQARIRLGHVERLNREYDSSLEFYESAISLASRKEEVAGQWARLWLGDLLLYWGQQDRAKEIWKHSRERRSLPGRIMHNLISDQRRQLQLDKKNQADNNDIEYFNALVELLDKKEENYKERLHKLTTVWQQGYDWPNPLARQILSELLTYTPP